MTTGRSAAGAFARFLVLAWIVTVILMGIGYVPTRRLAGESGLVAMAAGCGISLAASVMGAIPLALWLGRGEGGKVDPGQRVPAVMMSMAVRFFVVLILGVAVALTGLLAKTPFLVWMGVSYLTLLFVDTAFALRSFSGPNS